MRTFITSVATVAAISLPMQSYSGVTVNIEDGEPCVNSVQCKSNCCRYVGSMAYCMGMAEKGEEGSAKTLYGIYQRCPCERKWSCEELDKHLGTSFCACVDSTAECNSCDTYTHVGQSTLCVGYEEYFHGKCGVNCGEYDTVYRCAEGYYGISHSDVVLTGDKCPSLCKPCPENGLCHEGFNETFYCRSGYYKTNNGCVRCPLVGINADGNETYGTVGTMMHKDGLDKCTASAGTYTDKTGTFELSSSECKYE